MNVFLDKLNEQCLLCSDRKLNLMIYDKSRFLLSLQQRFLDTKPEYEMINESRYWSVSIPHETSGPCYTYDPPEDSDPGYVSGIHLTMNSETWDPNLEIFLHTKGKFFYQDDWTSDTSRIDPEILQQTHTGHPRVSGI